MKCSKCGNEVISGAVFCDNCGEVYTAGNGFCGNR